MKHRIFRRMHTSRTKAKLVAISEIERSIITSIESNRRLEINSTNALLFIANVHRQRNAYCSYRQRRSKEENHGQKNRKKKLKQKNKNKNSEWKSEPVFLFHIIVCFALVYACVCVHNYMMDEHAHRRLPGPIGWIIIWCSHHNLKYIPYMLFAWRNLDEK